jgi:hypothetical protein
LALALGCLVASSSCAKGGDPTPGAAEVAPGSDTEAGADGGCVPCSASQVCSAGLCVASDADDDADGVKASQDCDDHDPATHPGAAEICNGKDDNCDGKIDEGFDADGDGVPSCAVGAVPADCDDADAMIHPGAPETCNEKDDNCDGKIDEGFDADNDGYYACAHATLDADCDDTDAKIYPGATEICNAKDDDCNGKIDEIPATLAGSLTPPIDPHWFVAGETSIVNGWAQITQDIGSQVGALWWSTPTGAYTFDAFDMSSTVWIQAKPDGADGMAFAWVPGTTNALGEGSLTWGSGGLGGYAVAIDTFFNTGEPAVPNLAIVQNAAVPVVYSRVPLPNVRDANNHTLRVQLGAGGMLSVWIDGINYVFNFPLPGYAPFSGRWGFTAATGGSSEAHWVTNVTMSFPNGQGCVP